MLSAAMPRNDPSWSERRRDDAEDRLTGQPADEGTVNDKLGSGPRRLEIGAGRDVGVCRRRRRHAARRHGISMARNLPVSLRIRDENAFNLGDAPDQIREASAKLRLPGSDLRPGQSVNTVGDASKYDRVRLQQPPRVFVEQLNLSAYCNGRVALHAIPRPPRHCSKQQCRTDNRGEQQRHEGNPGLPCHRERPAPGLNLPDCIAQHLCGHGFRRKSRVASVLYQIARSDPPKNLRPPLRSDRRSFDANRYATD